jgi:hypothetical protein
VHVLALLRRKTESFAQSEFDALLDDEAERARVLYAQGIVRAAWSRDDVPGACFMLEVESIPQAQAAMGSLPFAERDMTEVQLIPLRGYRGFGPRNP